STGPPDIPARLEDLDRLLAGPPRVAQLAGHGIGLREAGLGERADFLEASGIGDAGGLAAMLDGDLGARASQAVQGPSPPLPGRPPLRILDTVDDVADSLQRL